MLGRPRVPAHRLGGAGAALTQINPEDFTSRDNLCALGDSYAVRRRVTTSITNDFPRLDFPAHDRSVPRVASFMNPLCRVVVPLLALLWLGTASASAQVRPEGPLLAAADLREAVSLDGTWT